MAEVYSEITVLFEEPFWIMIYERTVEKRYEVAKVTFGAEPKDYQVFDYLIKNYDNLRFSKAVKTKSAKKEHINPKRIQRKINKELAKTQIGTKAQNALKLQYEENKIAKKSFSKEQKEAEKERKRQLHNEKKKEKHKGH